MGYYIPNYHNEEKLNKMGCPRCGHKEGWHRIKDPITGKEVARRVGRAAVATWLEFSPPGQTAEFIKKYHYRCDVCGFDHTWKGDEFFK